MDECVEQEKLVFPEFGAENIECCCSVALGLDDHECTLPEGYGSIWDEPEETPRTGPFVESDDNTPYENELGKKYTTMSACQNGESFDGLDDAEYENIWVICFNYPYP